MQSNNLSLSFVEGLYEQYLRDPASVPRDWQQYFDELGRDDGQPGAEMRIGPSFKPRSVFNPPDFGNGHGGNGHTATASAPQPRIDDAAALQDRVDQLVRNYRVRGHINADINPLGMPRPRVPELDPAHHGLIDADMDRPFSSRSIKGPDVMTLRQIIQKLQNTYCRSIGVQFMHIDDLAVRQWLQDRMEGTENRIDLSRRQQLRILNRLSDAVVFEEFIQKKFIGAKSFSLEGAESLIPLLDLAFEKAGDQGVREVVLAMAHRGRLNVLANIVGKSPQQIFREFEDLDPHLHMGRGDVKYHLGDSTDWVTASGQKVHLSLCFNPSHLEFVNPVALGRLRAKQDRSGDYYRKRGLCMLIHGDAAFAGEGIVQETLNLSELRAYTTGGAIHVIINNQLGFTTTPGEGRSTVYATDVAKMLQSPIFHVNGEDPEAVAQVVSLAMDFRERYQRDVVIDMYCYRRRGHNESDEPSFTQPMLYAAIEKRKTVREGYLEHLLKLGGITREEADRITEDRRNRLEDALRVARSEDYKHGAKTLGGVWQNFKGGLEDLTQRVETGVDRQRLAELLEKQTTVPEHFTPHPKIEKLLTLRRQMAQGEKPLDWAAAEACAFASLATEGFRVRMSGQDCERGTFSHRHAVLHDVRTGHTFTPLQQLAAQQGPVEIYNSPLSETAVLGFEYGYSLDSPEGLVLWEAQFGDFVNVAQPIIDQFIASAEDKWRRLNGLVMLLPHGFEGMGPEHSSARLERFLALGAEHNIRVAYPSTPAQYFHMLRRQVHSPWRKPLFVMTPKSLLRNPRCTSSLDELTRGHFHLIINDDTVDPKKASRVLLCSGKVYYELAERREALKRHDIAIIRLEQLYPLDNDAIGSVLEPYPNSTPVFWVQEEPKNMGAWRHLRTEYGNVLVDRNPLDVITRPASASPATGSASSHKIEQEQLLAAAIPEK